MENLLNFRFKEILNSNQTEKVIYLLGRVQGSEGQAIVILTPKLQDPTSIDFQKVETSFINDIYGLFNAELVSKFGVQMIFPITEKHKNKYRAKNIQIHFQSGEEYAAKSQEILKRQLAHIQWVCNIIEGKSQVERVLYREKDFLIIPDFKYSDFKDVKKLHIMTIFSDPKLQSLRDLTGEHLPLLKRVQESINQVLIDNFGIKYENVRVYFHYPPTFYRLHIHIMHLALESLSCRVERCHDLNLVIQNIGIKSSYYQQVTLNTFIEK